MRADAATGRTIVFATHYLAEADAFAERTVLMARGRIVEDGPTADVRAAFGGRTVSFKPPADVVRPHGLDEDWLARVREALAPLGVEGVEVASASLEAAFLALTATSRPDPAPTTCPPSRPPEPHEHPDRPRAHEPTRDLVAAGHLCRLDLKRQLRDKMGMFFTVGLPAFMYLVFGLGSDDAVGSGNVSTYVMISMAAYGAVSATTGTAGSATEMVMGWGRQLSLTPIRPLRSWCQDRHRDDRGRGADRADLRHRRGHGCARRPR